jgi:hypothetical protein
MSHIQRIRHSLGVPARVTAAHCAGERAAGASAQRAGRHNAARRRARDLAAQSCGTPVGRHVWVPAAATPASGTNRSKPPRCKAMREFMRCGRALDLVSPFIEPATARPAETALDRHCLRAWGGSAISDLKEEANGHGC